jgi:hypothetical protein
LPTGALATVKGAVELAMPPYERKVKLDGRDAIVTVAAAGHSAYDYRAGGCGGRAWARSIVATVLLPHVERATDRRPGRHERANDGDRRKHEYTEGHKAEGRSTSEKRPHPKPTAPGEMSAKQRSESRRIWPPRVYTVCEVLTCSPPELTG